MREAPLVGPNAGGFVSRVDGIYGGVTIANGAIVESAIGSPFDDTIIGNAYSNELFGGGGGNDELLGIELVYGSRYDDLLEGGSGDNFLGGQQGNDRLFGRDGNDSLIGGAGDDRLFGGSGDGLCFLSGGDDQIHDFDATDKADALFIGDIFSDSNDALANAKQVGSNTLFTYAAGATTLINVAKSALGEEDFVSGLA